MRDLSLMTWNEVKETDKQKSIVFVVMAPIEEHGRHLPLATDLIEGEYWSRETMKATEERLGLECFYLPSFPVASATVNEFYGSIHFTMRTTYETAYAILDSIRCMGFRHIIVIASHADPQHQIAVEKAVRKINKKHGTCVIAPMGPIFMGVSAVKSEGRLEELEKQHGNDYHAGWIETSSLLDIDMKYVRPCYRKLPNTRITDKDMIFRKRQIRAMGDYGYIGSPQYSTAEIGKELNEQCVASLYEAVERFYHRDGYREYSDYSLYKILPLHIGFLRIEGKVRRKKVAE